MKQLRNASNEAFRKSRRKGPKKKSLRRTLCALRKNRAMQVIIPAIN